MKQGDITVCDPFQEYQPASEMHKRMIAAIIFQKDFGMLGFGTIFAAYYRSKRGGGDRQSKRQR